MHCINVHNVNQGLAEGLRLLNNMGVAQESRAGPVLVMREPVTTVYDDPTARVLFSPLRDANPFFHFFEGLWMLAGRNDLAFLKQFNSKFSAFSDDGRTIPGAYGYRWRRGFGFDQLPHIIRMLKDDHTTRRAVLAMWGADADLSRTSVDIPCNTHVYFDAWQGVLNMTVCCRSNDIWWGCYGANAVHFSMLQEYVAAGVGLPVGKYTQMSNNFHLYPYNIPHAKDADGAYLNFENSIDEHVAAARSLDRYTALAPSQVHGKRTPQPNHATPKRVPMVQFGKGAFDEDLRDFMKSGEPRAYGYIEPFFEDVACPMYRAWEAHKNKDYVASFEHASDIKAGDWSISCTEWLERRAVKRQQKETMA